MSFSLPRVNTIFGQTTFNYTGIKAWNALPSDAQNILSKALFKKSIKSLLLENVLQDEQNLFTI